MTNQMAPHRIGQQYECGVLQAVPPLMEQTGKKAGKKAGKKGRKGEAADKASIGSSRGIESMFRSAYRTQLDMLALAATKANIMISLNGLLLSILLVSGTYLLGVEPLLVIPFVTFLITCVTAIFFAVLAARPSIVRNSHRPGDFPRDNGYLLMFDRFSKLDRETYQACMEEMARDKTLIYKNMIAHIHGMGQQANANFTRLYYAYSAFLIGIVISMGLLLVVMIRAMLFGA